MALLFLLIVFSKELPITFIVSTFRFKGVEIYYMIDVAVLIFDIPGMDDFNKHPVDTLEEVKKLQDLVRKLELQNQQLRNKQNKIARKSSLPSPKDGTKQSTNVLKIVNSNVDSDKICLKNNCDSKTDIQCPSEIENQNIIYLDEIDIITVSDVDISDDESWLYMSPKGLTQEQKSESPYKWLRKDFDDPENKQLQLAKRALVSKLNEFDILSPASQRNQFKHVENRTISSLRKSLVPYKAQDSSQEHIQYSLIDTRTFTKSKKKQALEYLASTPLMNNINRETEKVDGDLCRRGSDVSIDSSTGTYTLADASDVQEVARMQEESLRLSSPGGTPKRHSGSSTVSGRKLSASSRGSISDMDNTDNAEHLPLSSQLSEVASEVSSLTPPSTQPERLNFSDNSSPSESPYGSNASLDNAVTPKGDSYRRSMPNLNRSRAITKSSKMPTSNERTYQKNFATKTGASGRRSDSNLLASAKVKREAVSPTRKKFKDVQHFVSPASSASSAQVPQGRRLISRNTESSTGRLSVKSGLPRPSRATSATRICSGIPVPSIVGKKNTEDSWSDGCF